MEPPVGLAYDGVAPAENRRRHHPVVVVMLAGPTDNRVLLAAIEAGCSDLLTKDQAADKVVDAVLAASAAETLVSPSIVAPALPKRNPAHRAIGSDLTDREREILGFLAHGWTNKVIASELHLSVNTVRNYVHYVLTKLGAHSKLEAVSTAVREGIIDYPSHR